MARTSSSIRRTPRRTEIFCGTFWRSRTSTPAATGSLPPPDAEAAVHPSDENDKHELYLMCDDVERTVRMLGAKGVACEPFSAQGWANRSCIRLPGRRRPRTRTSRDMAGLRAAVLLGAAMAALGATQAIAAGTCRLGHLVWMAGVWAVGQAPTRARSVGSCAWRPPHGSSCSLHTDRPGGFLEISTIQEDAGRGGSAAPSLRHDAGPCAGAAGRAHGVHRGDATARVRCSTVRARRRANTSLRYRWGACCSSATSCTTASRCRFRRRCGLQPGKAVAGYSGRPLAKKLSLKDVAAFGAHARVGGGRDRGGGPLAHQAGGARAADRCGACVRDQPRGLGRLGQRAPGEAAPSVFSWVSWPKRASRIATDVTEDDVRRVALPTGQVDIKVRAVDETWSGLKLVIRRRAAVTGDERQGPRWVAICQLLPQGSCTIARRSPHGMRAGASMDRAPAARARR